MALFHLSGDALQPIAQSTFAELGLRERQNLQRALRERIDAITPDTRTMVLAEEFGDWVEVNRRIDLLCLDDQARLVIVELKRDQSGHMELQALRYAAMVSTMRFDQAVEAHRKYLRRLGSDADAEQAVRAFLGAVDGPVALSETVRIVLAASEFSTEVTTTVLWLNQRGLDIRCVQMRPHPVDGRVLLDIQQVIPLPEAEQYQVALREKTMEQVAAKSHARDFTRFDLTIGDASYANLPKRRLIYEIVAEAVRRGVTPEQMSEAVPWSGATMFVSAAGRLESAELRAALGEKPIDRYFEADDELFHVGGRTYALTNQWGARTLEAITCLQEVMTAGADIDFVPTTPVVEEATWNDYVVRKRSSGTIEVEQAGTSLQPVLPTLKSLASMLGVSTRNGKGNDYNTRQLGAMVMRAMEAADEDAGLGSRAAGTGASPPPRSVE